MTLDAPEGYSASALRPPLPSRIAESLLELLEHKGVPWMRDIEARLKADGDDLFAVAFHERRPVAHSWLGWAGDCRESGVIGHVFTAQEHRRHGLAEGLVRGLISAFDEGGGRWVQLRTSSEAAARIYGRLGFRTIRTTEPGRSERPRRVMLRGGGEDGAADGYHEASGRWEVEGFALRHYPRTCVFLNATTGERKLPVGGIDTGLNASLHLLELLQGQEDGRCRCSALIDTDNGRVHGFACRGAGVLDVHAPHVDGDAAAMFTREAART